MTPSDLADRVSVRRLPSQSRWRRRWEARFSIGQRAWVVAYGRTRRRAMRALHREMGWPW